MSQLTVPCEQIHTDLQVCNGMNERARNEDVNSTECFTNHARQEPSVTSWVLPFLGQVKSRMSGLYRKHC